MEHKGDNYTNCNWCAWNVTKGLLKGLEDMVVGGRVETIHATTLLRTARILRDSRRLGVTQSPVKDHQLTLI